MSCASYLGAGHRIEFFGEDGTLVLNNPTRDYMRGFELYHARRPAAALERIAVDDPDRRAIPRRAHRAGVAARQGFLRRYRARHAGHAGLRRRLSRADADRRRAALARARRLDRRAARHRRLRRVSCLIQKFSSPAAPASSAPALVKALVQAGATRCACSTTIRAARRAASPTSRSDIEFVGGDIRDAGRRRARATRGIDEVHHLAFVNGTAFFYSAARSGARCRRARA